MLYSGQLCLSNASTSICVIAETITCRDLLVPISAQSDPTKTSSLGASSSCKVQLRVNHLLRENDEFCSVAAPVWIPDTTYSIPKYIPSNHMLETYCVDITREH